MRSSVVAVVIAIGMSGCGSGSAQLDCGQGVDRDVCERVAEFATDEADVTPASVHVQPRSCERYLDPVPADARCWSVRFDQGDVVSVVQVGGELHEAEDLFPITP